VTGGVSRRVLTGVFCLVLGRLALCAVDGAAPMVELGGDGWRAGAALGSAARRVEVPAAAGADRLGGLASVAGEAEFDFADAALDFEPD
jgi:hypothetical protein